MMSASISSTAIEAAARHVAETLIAEASEFNRLDAAGGDGDMGTTLATVGRAISRTICPTQTMLVRA